MPKQIHLIRVNTEQERHLVTILLAKLRNEPVEFRDKNSGDDWQIADMSHLFNWGHQEYRLKPQEILTIDQWKLLEPEWKYVAKSDNGKVYLFEGKPTLGNVLWWAGDECVTICPLKLSSNIINSINWKESLQERPREAY